MPAKSKAQARMMGMKCAGKSNRPKSMTKEQACEYIRDQKVSKLPTRVKKKPAKKRAKSK